MTSGRFRVKVRSPHTVIDYVVTANSRDAAWLHVAHQLDAGRLDELTPDRTTELPELVFWASPVVESDPPPRQNQGEHDHRDSPQDHE